MVDVQAQIDAVDRAVGMETLDGADTRLQTLGQTYRAPIGDVWDAMTTADRIPRWFLPITGDLRLGGSYQLDGNAGGVIEECSSPADGGAHFRVTWVYGGGAPTWLTVRLTAEGEGSTRVGIEFRGRADDLPEEMWQQFGPAATGIGWDQGLLGLALHLGGDRDGIAPEDAASWTMSEDGRRFMRLSADAWAQAHVDAGANRKAAAAAADTTYAMYTGAAPSPSE